MINPYAPLGNEAAIETREHIQKALARPATALVIMASIHSVLFSVDLVNRALLWSSNAAISILPALVYLVLFLCQVFIAIGAAKMGHLESYRLARMAMLLACIPFLSPFIVLGIPFGLWGLSLLASSRRYFRDVQDSVPA